MAYHLEPEGHSINSVLKHTPFWLWVYDTSKICRHELTHSIDVVKVFFFLVLQTLICFFLSLSSCTGDVCELIQVLGYETCILVGHDWGGLIGWKFVAQYPQMVERYIAMNIPHPDRFSELLTSHLPQIIMSWWAKAISSIPEGPWDGQCTNHHNNTNCVQSASITKIWG